MDSSLADFPHEHDMQSALSQVKGGKGAGSSGIPLEMLKIGQTNGDFMFILTELVSVLEGGACAARLVGCHSCFNS